MRLTHILSVPPTPADATTALKLRTLVDQLCARKGTAASSAT
jgi:hypothetical protein